MSEAVKLGRSQIEYTINDRNCWILTSHAFAGRKSGAVPVKIMRKMYEHHVGPVDDNEQLIHDCGEPHCCNPAHARTVWKIRAKRLSKDQRERGATQGKLLAIIEKDERNEILSRIMGKQVTLDWKK